MTFAPIFRRVLVHIAGAAMLVWMTGCSSLNKASSSVAGKIEPYRMEVVQGNVVSREQIAALPKGATRAQVVAVLGTPLLTSVFHADRWVYAFSLNRQGKPSQLRHVTVFFKDDQLERIEADELPSESEFVGSLPTKVELPPAKPLEASEKALAKFPAPAAAVPPAPLPPARASYPPLEQ
jgi:outer membrane protein assembly factor BamE